MKHVRLHPPSTANTAYLGTLMKVPNVRVLRLCLAAAAVLLVGSGDVGDAELAAPHGGASDDIEQADASRMLLQAQQDKMAGRDAYNLIGGVRIRI